jgi:signal transduction histidine kinase
MGRAARSLLITAWAAVALIHLALVPGLRVRFLTLGYLVLELLASASLGFRASRSCGAARRAWGLLALSAGLEVLNLALDLPGLHGRLGAGFQVVTNLLTLASGMLVLAGVLSFPRRTDPEGRLRRVLDGLIFATSILFLLWLLGLRTALQPPVHGIAVRVLVDYLNVALLGGSLVFLMSDQLSFLRGPVGWLGASALAWLLGLAWFTLAGFAPTQGQAGWLAVVGAIPLFQGLAAWSPWEPLAAETQAPVHPRLARLLPYAPAVPAVAALAYLLPRAPLELMRGAIGIFLLLVVLLMLRQFQTIQDLQVARRTLEDRVHARTRALEQAQDTLLRTERMNTLALMGAGLAHDLNNLLAVMKAASELALLEAEEGRPPAPESLARIAETADRAATLTRHLMGFVRQEEDAPAPLDLRTALDEVQKTLRMLVPRGVSLQISLPSDLALIVRSSRARLEQMLVNLVVNAVDAMPAGGRLDIQVGPSHSESARVAIEVADTGCGMAPEVLERIFDPFFTTKPPGKGTGLGLPSLKALVEEAGGRMEVESHVGRGSRFRILLPEYREFNSSQP